MVKVVKKYKYPTAKEIRKMCEEALNQDNREEIIDEIKYLKDK